MATSAEERLAALEQLVIDQNAKLQKSLKTTIVVYLILVVLVFAYTFFAAGKIQELTSREAVAEMVGSAVREELPKQRAALMQQLNENSEKMAKDSVQYLVTRSADLEPMVRDLLDTYTDQLVEDLHNTIMPAFADYVKADSKEIKAHFDTLTDEEVVQGTVELMVEVFEQEMDKHINDSFLAHLEELQKAIAKLGNPNAKLTKKEDAERRTIMYWTYLTEISETGESPFKTLFDEVNARYHLFSGEDIEQMNTPMVDEDVKGAVEAE